MFRGGRSLGLRGLLYLTGCKVNSHVYVLHDRMQKCHVLKCVSQSIYWIPCECTRGHSKKFEGVDLDGLITRVYLEVYYTEDTLTMWVLSSAGSYLTSLVSSIVDEFKCLLSLSLRFSTSRPGWFVLVVRCTVIFMVSPRRGFNGRIIWNL